MIQDPCLQNTTVRIHTKAMNAHANLWALHELHRKLRIYVNKKINYKEVNVCNTALTESHLHFLF